MEVKSIYKNVKNKTILHSPPQSAFGDTADVEVVEFGENKDDLQREDISALKSDFSRV